MYDNWGANGTVFGATIVAVGLAVLMHYEGLILLSRVIGVTHARHQRIKVLYAIMTLIFLHIFEIWIFGLVLWLVIQLPGCGTITGETANHVFDAIYLSAITFSTVGYGDVAPLGPVRFLAGTEALVGLVLITWSASFAYLEMGRLWRQN